jgi:hypothetical protein
LFFLFPENITNTFDRRFFNPRTFILLLPLAFLKFVALEIPISFAYLSLLYLYSSYPLEPNWVSHALGSLVKIVIFSFVLESTMIFTGSIWETLVFLAWQWHGWVWVHFIRLGSGRGHTCTELGERFWGV